MENKKINIAIIDDSEVIRERIAAKLSAINGLEVVWQAVDLPDSYKSFELQKPDAVILDIQLPSGNGIEFLEHIKKTHKDIITIMLTNYPINQFRKKCIDSGADFFFDKSTEFEKVFYVLKSLANKSLSKIHDGI
jgi:DNA-binding NarL/FixJ family response regulator